MSKILAIRAAVIFISLNILQNSYAAGACTASRSSSDEESEVISTIHDFGKNLSYTQWSRDPKGNSVLSPLSITTVLNLLMAGTELGSNLEIRQVLNYSNNLQENAIHDVYGNIFKSLQQSVNGVKIGLYTRLFLQKDFPVLNSYTNIAKRSYFSEVENLDFRGSARESTNKINNWVSNSTEGKIEELFPRPLSTDTVCVVVNVMYFNATWENQFSSRATRKGIFSAGRENITIPFMTSDMTIRIIKDNRNGFEMIALPYKGYRYSMYIIKPSNINANELKRIENLLHQELLDSLICKMAVSRVLVTLPRMKVRSKIDLKRDLMSFGVNEIFNPTEADFGRLTNRSNLYVSDVIHKAILEVTEAGTTAAAVTAASISPTSLPPIFKVDRPVLLFIRDDDKGVILFWARVIRPEPLN